MFPCARVCSCNDPGGGMIVIEGHRLALRALVTPAAHVEPACGRDLRSKTLPFTAMRAVAVKPAPRRRGGLRWIVGLLIILLLAVAAAIWLNSAAAPSPNAGATLTVCLAT